jgi:hypothetical protein
MRILDIEGEIIDMLLYGADRARLGTVALNIALARGETESADENSYSPEDKKILYKRLEELEQCVRYLSLTADSA